MGHGKPLYRPVSVKCQCCALPYTATFRAPNDVVVCAPCVPHLRGTQEASQRRNVEHIRMWQSHLDDRRRDHDDAIRAERARHSELEQMVRERDATIESLRSDVNALNGEMQRVLEQAALGPVREPNERVIKLLAGTVAEQAEVKREQAYRMRNSALGRLWAVDELHHEDDDHRGYCTCELPVRHCKVFGALTPLRSALYKWEIAEADRLDRGLPHGLPADHPKVIEHSRRREQRYS